jgi:NADPH-dependent 7-cyano-7-deazaguanine reductase QueF-like protein
MGGCFSSKQVSAEGFRIEIKKLRIYLHVQSTKKMTQCQELEKMLLNELRKTFGRSASVESSLIEQIVTGINHIHGNHSFT